MKGHGTRASITVLESSITQMVVNTRDSGKIVARTDKVNSQALTEQFTKVSGKTANTMDKVASRLQLAKNTKENSKMVNISHMNINTEL